MNIWLQKRKHYEKFLEAYTINSFRIFHLVGEWTTHRGKTQNELLIGIKNKPFLGKTPNCAKPSVNSFRRRNKCFKMLDYLRTSNVDQKYVLLGNSFVPTNLLCPENNIWGCNDEWISYVVYVGIQILDTFIFDFFKRNSKLWRVIHTWRYDTLLWKVCSAHCNAPYLSVFLIFIRKNCPELFFAET